MVVRQSRKVMATAVPHRKPSADVLVVGGGVIGLSAAVFAARSGLTVRVIEAGLPGGASRVAAGLLAPSLGPLPERAAEAFRKAASGYGQFLSTISELGGFALSAEIGILEVAMLPHGPESLNRARDRSAIRLSGEDVANSVAELSPVTAGVLHPDDGWIEPALLLDGLVAALPAGTVAPGRARGIDTSGSHVSVTLDSGESLRGGHVVIAAGAWSPSIDGLPTRLPITPARGEVLVLETDHVLPHAIACEDFYLVPRPGEIVVGSTFEFVGYDSSTTTAGRSTLERFAARAIPRPFARATAKHMWAGLRPMTPDTLPVIDFDPSDPRVIFACGHGKNGLLLAGLTAEIVLDLIAGNRQESVFPFRLDRFEID